MPNREASFALLHRGRTLGSDAKVEEVSIEGRFLLAWQATVDVMNALLQTAPESRKLPRGTHIDRIDRCRRIAPEVSEALDGINDSRHRRNLIAYSGHGAEVDVLARLLRDLAAIDDAVERRLTQA